VGTTQKPHPPTMEPTRHAKQHPDAVFQVSTRQVYGGRTRHPVHGPNALQSASPAPFDHPQFHLCVVEVVTVAVERILDVLVCRDRPLRPKAMSLRQSIAVGVQVRRRVDIIQRRKLCILRGLSDTTLQKKGERMI
ncbi:hypothetical protein HDU99_003397, partial [Rhizoclosmatium hyalinum]